MRRLRVRATGLAVCYLLSANNLAKAAEPASPSYGRATLEMLGLLGGAALWYWIDIERNLADWDRLSLGQRFRLDAIRLDNNDFSINHIAHPLAGGAYYAFARANGLSVAMSSTYALLTSMAWEYGLEFQERTSYNDFIVTPGAGIALGEAVHSLGTYLTSGCNSGWAEALAWGLGFPVALHKALDGHPVSCRGPRDSLGLDANTAHQFTMSYGVGTQQLDEEQRTHHWWQWTSELIEIPGYRRANFTQGAFYGGEWTRMKLSLHAGRDTSGVSFDVHSILAGLYHHQASANSRVSALAGFGLGYQYRVHDTLAWREQVSEMHLVGLYYNSTLEMGGLHLDFGGRVSPDFTATNSLALAQYRATNPSLRGKSVLSKQGYYFGYGWSGSAKAEIGYGELAFGAQIVSRQVNSLQGQDRVQELLEVDEKGAEGRDTLTAYLQTALPRVGVTLPHIRLHWRRSRRRSVLHGHHNRAQFHEYGLQFRAEL